MQDHTANNAMELQPVSTIGKELIAKHVEEHRSANTTDEDTTARSAWGALICWHNKQQGRCKECRGSSICEHNRDKN
eukprot:965635-Rhodomonas_salina.1